MPVVTGMAAAFIVFACALAAAENGTPLALFMDEADTHDAWGLIQPVFNRAASVNASLGLPSPSPKQVLLLQPVPGVFPAALGLRQ